MIEIITATRLSAEEFWQTSALGQSLKRVSYDNTMLLAAFFENKHGLSEIYNECIVSGDANNLIVFIHDDVWIDDCFFSYRVQEGLKHYDVLGVAGTKRRIPLQPGWGYMDKEFNIDDRVNLSGLIAQGEQPLGQLYSFGDVPAECELMDGVFLAAKKQTLIQNNVFFDPQFQFHFYDLDFCRTARQQGLRLGTWPICLTHQSSGAFGEPRWVEQYHRYIKKWGD